MIELGEHRYGKSAIRLVRVIRKGSRHTVRDLTVAIALEGDFRAAHVDGDNGLVVTTDTMKNTVYAFAREHLTGSIERFAHVLGRHFVGFPQVERATVSIDEHTWARIGLPGGEADDAFVRRGDLTRTATATVTRDGSTIEAGLRDLAVMKTAGSAFSGFPRDEFTTLAETDDRIMATLVTAMWRYGGSAEGLDHDACFDAILGTLLEVFADHRSPSVQASIWIIAQAILERHAEVDEVRMTLPNLHHWPVDLGLFGIPNDREIFVATREPHGLIEATVRRIPRERDPVVTR